MFEQVIFGPTNKSMQSNSKFKPFIEVGIHFDYLHIINSATSSTITNS